MNKHKLCCSIFLFIGFLLSLPLLAADNLAFQAKVWASTEGLPAANAVDGNPNTRWGSTIGVDPSWIAVDLGSNSQINNVSIDWEAANAEVYEIQGSNDGIQWNTIIIKTGGAFGNRTDSVDINASYRYIRIYGIKRSAGNNWGYSIWELKIFGTKLAESQISIVKASASSELQSATNAIDGNMNTRWESNHQIDPSWLQADLGKAYALSKVIINWEAANPELYEIQGSNTGSSWTTINTQTNGTFGNRTDTISLNGTYRYLRVYGTKRSKGNNWGYSIWELKIYGTLSSEPPVPPQPPTDPDYTYVPLYTNQTALDPETTVTTDKALITRFADRARDRHAREDQFQAYEHYLSFYWLHRTAQIEIIDEIAKGGKQITFNVKTEWPLGAPEFRAFYRGIGTVAEYWHNVLMTRNPTDRLKYSTIVNYNAKMGREIRLGDRMEIEVSQFLDSPPEGRANYYGTAYLYIVGEGIVPWEARGVFGNPNTEREDSYPIPVMARLGGKTTIHQPYSNEPEEVFKQMATNISNINGQQFMLGRRIHHTDMITGNHSEQPNPNYPELVNKTKGHFVNTSCVACHKNNGRATPPSVGTVLNSYLFKVGDANGNPHPKLGRVLEPQSNTGPARASVSILNWVETNGLRKPNYQFSKVIPEKFSARITPQLVGMGLLEAIPESAIAALADPNNQKGTGITGRMHIVTDLVTKQPRLGRFGWKASKATLKQQVAQALNDDMAIITSVLPVPNCPAEAGNCISGDLLSDENLDSLVTYISLLGVRAQRNPDSAQVKLGEKVFIDTGCAACHIQTFTTSAYHPRAELRNQVIHPYTDLLLHDMGANLADNLIEEGASGAEWRTAPLWNIGFTARVSGSESYLHDGRARTLNEAILWHGGEAESSRNAYNKLSADSRNALLEFLKSL